jgi:hypothetical protein
MQYQCNINAAYIERAFRHIGSLAIEMAYFYCFFDWYLGTSLLIAGIGSGVGCGLSLSRVVDHCRLSAGCAATMVESIDRLARDEGAQRNDAWATQFLNY